MDFERASIKALFYDYPVEAVVKAIEDARRNKDGYIDILPQLVRWREEAFTTTEARLMENLSQDIWMNLNSENALSEYVDEQDATRIPFIYRPFLLVRYMADILVTHDAKTHQPMAVFDELLRWKDTTLFVGEDLLTTAYLANKDVISNPKCQTTLFAWPDHIRHNNEELHAVLSRGVIDIHAHYNATCDVFNLNWIDLTNSLNKIDKKLKDVKQYQDVTLSVADTEQLYTFKRMCIAATYLRVQFFKLLNNPCTPDKQLCHKLMCVKRILEDEMYANRIKRDLSAEIGVLRTSAIKSRNGRTLDYAILPDKKVKGHVKDANIIFHGERKLMYQFFYHFYGYDKTMWALAPYFYLYLVLKTRIRKEFVQINQLKGFENFETYQDRKDIFIKEQDPIAEVFDPIVLQTTLRNSNNDCLEGRITPKELRHMTSHSRMRVRNYNEGVFTQRKVLDNAAKHLSLVVHFIKANYSKSEKAHDLYLSNRQDYPRYYNYRNELKGYIQQVLSVYQKQQSRPNDIQIVGIDAASTEMFCRPEVFGHAFRYARKKGLNNLTYHVGEDFFDIVDGLRAIDEAMLFLGLGGKCRIGHGLAMGIEAKQYYSRRHYRIIAPKQYVLDNCVWLCMTASKEDVEIPNSLETELNRLARELYKAIGYNKVCPFDMQTYRNSMLLRGDEPCKLDQNSNLTLWAKAIMTDWAQTAEVDEEIVNIARQDQEACLLYQTYHFDHEIKVNGEKRYQGKYPETIADIVDKLQAKMRRKVCAKQIAVETNPSSNLKIGFVDKYCEHPLLQKFDPITEQANPSYPLLNASVNTDDRGVFATTLYNEFSLLALGMMKEKKTNGDPKYGTRQVMEYIEHLRQAGEKQRFK